MPRGPQEVHKKIDRADNKNQAMNTIMAGFNADTREFFRDQIVLNGDLLRLREIAFTTGHPNKETSKIAGLRRELGMIKRSRMMDEEQKTLLTVNALLRWKNIPVRADITIEEILEVLDSELYSARQEVRLQTMWDITEMSAVVFCGAMVVITLLDGGFTVSSILKVGLWAGAGYGAHKLIRNREMVWAKYQAAAAQRGLPTLRGKEAAATATFDE